MRATFVTESGSQDKPNEDWVLVSPGLAVVLDGATARTDTGCVHGVAWFAHQLGAAIVANAVAPGSDLTGVLAHAIERVVALHPECDLDHPGTPSAGVGLVRFVGDVLDYLALGDVSLLIETKDDLISITDDRVSKTAHPDRGEAERLPIGSPEKAEALLRMKRGELAARNRPGGYWVAANDPSAAAHAIAGQVSLSDVRGVALLSDGAARAVTFGIIAERDVVDMLRVEGPEGLIRRVRDAEATDPAGTRWPRNKASDDATAVILM